jgi:HEAT repeat protein
MDDVIDLLQQFAESSDPDGELTGQIASMTFAIHALLKFHADPEVGILTAAALARIDPSNGETVLPILVEGLRSTDEAHKVYAAYAIRSLGPVAAAAVPALIEVLHYQEHETARYHSIQALGYIGPAAIAAVPYLVEILQGVSNGCHGVEVLHALGAAAALGEIRDRAAIPALKACLDLDADGDELVEMLRHEVIIALAKIGHNPTCGPGDNP